MLTTRNLRREMAEQQKERGVWVTQAHMRLTGSPDSALFLAQCVYWSKCKIVEQRSGWFYKTRNEWQAETCLSRYKQEKARQRLKELGVLQERHERRNDGIRLWYRINLGLLNRKLNALGETMDIVESTSCMDVQSEKTGLKEVNSDSVELVSTPVDTGSTEISKKESNNFSKGCFSGTNVQDNNNTDTSEYQCFSLNPEDYVFCHVFIYQFVKTQLHGTVLRSHWQLYGLAHEDLFNRFCEFIEQHGQAMVDWYRENAALEVPTLTGDDITFCNIAGRGMYASA